MQQDQKPRVFLRVKKDDIKITSFTKPDGMAVCLECWKLYIASGEREGRESMMQLRIALPARLKSSLLNFLGAR